MDKFTSEEATLIIKNSKAIINYLKTEIAPKLRTTRHFAFPFERGTKDLRLSIYPTSSSPITLRRGHEYEFQPQPNEYDYFFSDKNLREQMALINNWTSVKKQLLSQIEADQSELNALHNFEL